MKNKLLIILGVLLICSCAHRKPIEVSLGPSVYVYKLNQREFWELDPSIAGHAQVNENSEVVTFRRSELQKESFNKSFVGSGIRPGTRFAVEISGRAK